MLGFFGALEKSKATEHMLRYGCLLLPLKDAPAFRLTVPSKVFDYMSIGRPIITNISGEGSSIIKEEVQMWLFLLQMHKS